MENRGRYFLGVGIGLLIAWVTGGLAYYVGGAGTFPAVIELEFVVSIAAFVVAYFTRKQG